MAILVTVHWGKGNNQILRNVRHRLLVHSDLKLSEDVIYENKGVNCENKDMKSEKQGSCGGS